METYVYRTNEEENSVDYLEQVARSYSNDFPHRIKWVMIALHGALYGFAISAAQGSNSNSVLKSDGKLISIWDALKRCKDAGHMSRFTYSQVLKTDDNDEYAIKFLSNALRNEFMHFKPKSWAIIANRLQEDVILPVVRVIEFLSLESGNVNLDSSQKVRVADAIASIRSSKLLP